MKAAAAERAQQEDAAAGQVAEVVGGLVFEGLQPGLIWGEKAISMSFYTGEYELTEETVNGRPVWQAVGGKDTYAFFASDSTWTVGDGENMRAGKRSAVLYTASEEPNALTPDLVKGGWVAWDGKGWPAAPGLHMRPWTAEEKVAKEAEKKAAAAEVFDQALTFAEMAKADLGAVVIEVEPDGVPPVTRKAKKAAAAEAKAQKAAAAAAAKTKKAQELKAKSDAEAAAACTGLIHALIDGDWQCLYFVRREHKNEKEEKTHIVSLDYYRNKRLDGTGNRLVESFPLNGVKVFTEPFDGWRQASQVQDHTCSIQNPLSASSDQESSQKGPGASNQELQVDVAVTEFVVLC
jgi:hypothetical protein